MRTYTIFDGDPGHSGHCAWTEHEELDLDTVGSAIAGAQKEALECGEYTLTDSLWIIVYDLESVVTQRRFPALA